MNICFRRGGVDAGRRWRGAAGVHRAGLSRARPRWIPAGVAGMILLVAWRVAGAGEMGSEPAGIGDGEVLARGAHHRVVRVDGATYTELAAGLHYFRDGRWQETREKFVVVDGQAVAAHGPHQVFLAANLRSAGSVTLVDCRGQRWRGHPLGLAYTDAATGRSVLLAELQDCQGVVVPPNQVLYSAALKGDCAADVRFTYTRRGFEQDVILREAPPSPSEWGLDPDTTRLEVLTEFIELPPHQRFDSRVRSEADRVRARQMAEPDLVDQHLDFGGLHLGPGWAFPDLAGQRGAPHRAGVPTGKSLEAMEGRTFLIEKVDYRFIRHWLSALPGAGGARPAGSSRARAANSARAAVRSDRTALALAIARPRSSAGRWTEAQLVRADGIAADGRASQPGLVLDYLAFNEPVEDWRFRVDTTYLVTGLVDLQGVTVFEGSVIKFGRGASLQIWGPVECATSAYEPAIFTAQDDDSVGSDVSIARSVSGGYAAAALAFKGLGRRASLHDLSIRHADVGIAVDPQIGVDVRHLQLVRGRVGVAWGAGSSVSCRNFLAVDLDAVFAGDEDAPAVIGEHGTVHRVNHLLAGLAAPARLTNCLLVTVTNLARFEGARVEVSPSDLGVFETAATGSHYLPAGSPHRNAGTLTMDPELQASLRTRTTEGPLSLSGEITRETTLRPRARRDADWPDLGFHYPGVDYVCAGVRLRGARLSLRGGVAVGVVGSGEGPALRVGAGSEFVALGTPVDPVRLLDVAVVRDDAAGRRTGAGGNFVGVRVEPSPGLEPRVSWRFVDSVRPGATGRHMDGGPGSALRPLEFRDCRFSGGKIQAASLAFAFTNCIFDRVNLEVASSDDEPSRQLHHNFFRSGMVQIELPTSTQVHARNNFFEGTSLSLSGTWLHSHNAYLEGADRLPGGGPTDRLIRKAQFEPGPLGAFYYPTGGAPGGLSALIEAGSGPAAASGLAHHTTRRDQRAKGAGQADIGFHYVALGTDGRPADADGDGRPDYLEDADGDLRTGEGETDWLTYDSAAGLEGSPAVLVFTPLE